MEGSMMKEYSVRINIKVPDKVKGEDPSEIVMDYTDNTEGEIRVDVSSQDLREETVSISYGVDADNAREAINRGLSALRGAFGLKTINDRDIVEVEAEIYIDPKELELVSKAEMARRLGLSATRINQLSGKAEFPKPTQRSGERSWLYRWGDILKWNEYRKTHSRPGRPPRSKAPSKPKIPVV